MYQIIYSPAAIEDYEKSILWYGARSLQAAEKFVIEVQDKIISIRQNPRQFPNKYKHYYETNLRKYPFSIIYIIKETEKQVLIIAVYHHKRNPKKKYKSKGK